MTASQEMLQRQRTESSVICRQSQQLLELAQSCAVVLERCPEQQPFCFLTTVYDLEVQAEHSSVLTLLVRLGHLTRPSPI